MLNAKCKIKTVTYAMHTMHIIMGRMRVNLLDLIMIVNFCP